jgi:hypothetical protein
MLSYGSAFANAGPAASWLPWCVAAALDAARAETVQRLLPAAAAAGLAFGLQLLAGEPAISLLTVLFAAVAAGAASLAPPGRRIGRTGVAGLFAGLLAAGVAAPLLLPLSQVFRLTYRGQHLYSARAFGASPFASWRMVEWLFPRFGGDPGALGQGAHWQYHLHAGDLVYIWSVTFGVLPLLALALAAARRRFWTRTTLLLTGGALVTLLFSFGFALPFYRLLYFTELLRRLRYPIKLYLLTTLCVALLSGFAIDALRRHRGGRLEALLLAGFVALYLAVFLAAAENGPLERIVRPYLAGLAAPPDALLPAIRRVFRGDALFGATAVSLLGLLFLPPAPPRGGGHALGFATLLLALPWGLPLFVSADQKDLTRPPALLPVLKGAGRLYVSPRLPEVAVLETGSSHRELLPTVAKLSRVQVEELIPATGASFGVRYLFDEDPDGSYGWVNRIAGEVLTASNPEERARLLKLFGARWVLAEAGNAVPGFHAVTGFSVAGRRLVLHETDSAAPELRWASRLFHRASLSGSLELARSDLFRSATDVVLPGARDENAGPATAPGTIAVRNLEADRASVDVEATASGHVVFSRTFFPSWKASLDGAPARIVLANGRDLAVAVPAGGHSVSFEYDRAPFTRGVVIQAAVFLSILVTAGYAATFRRGSSHPRT